MELPDDEAHVWLARPDEARGDDLTREYAALLSAEEYARWRGFRFERHRHLYLVAHALLRTVLSRYADLEPRAWTFVANEHGRPEVAGDAAWLRFSLSHTAGMIACAVVRACDVGADVENVTRRTASLPIADRYFSAPEAAALRALPAEDVPRRFFDYWTLKESYVKARGVGLTFPLDSFTFDLRDPATIRIVFHERANDVAADWHFALFEPSPHHVGAIAVRRGRRELRVRRWVTIPCGEGDASEVRDEAGPR